MSDEAAHGSAGTPDGGGHPQSGGGVGSPLQARAEFLKNWDWIAVVSINRGACERGGAQHGFNRETQATCRREWEEKQRQILSLAELIEFLRQCHRRAREGSTGEAVRLNDKFLYKASLLLTALPVKNKAGEDCLRRLCLRNAFRQVYPHGG